MVICRIFLSKFYCHLLTVLLIISAVGCALSDNNVELTVALDGTGTHTRISDALFAAPNRSMNPVVIKVKTGNYQEQVIVPEWKTNIHLIGEGMGRTVVTGSKRGADTEASSTFGVEAEGFMAQDMTFSNTAGVGAGPAVAFRSVADKTALYRCSIEGYQDTLFTQLNRHFFRECNIYGTVDIIFGISRAVVQNCKVFFRLPVPGQQDVLTAQGRETPTDSSGIVFQNCFIDADPKSREPSGGAYLGRPWKPYSRTIIMNSYIGSVINSEGWLPWQHNTKTLTNVYYAEYMNHGPGSGTRSRIRCPGCKLITDPAEAQMFTVRNFINGFDWIPATGITFFPDLMP